MVANLDSSGWQEWANLANERFVGEGYTLTAGVYQREKEQKASHKYNHVEEVWKYRQVSNIRRTLVGNQIVDYSDVVGTSPVGAAPTTSSFST